MNVKPKFVYYDIRRKQSVCLIMYTHENDVDTQVLEVSMLDNGEPIELDADYTYSAAIVNRDTKALINDNISCELNDSGNVLIPIDNFHTLGAQDLLIELTITDSAGDQVLVTPFPLWIHVNASILDDAQVTPESLGTVPELLEEAKGALETVGDYDNLTHKPQINGHELVGNKSSDDLGLQGKLTAGENITIDANGEISATGGVTSYTELADKPRIEGHELLGNKTANDLGLQQKLFFNSNRYNYIENGQFKFLDKFVLHTDILSIRNSLDKFPENSIIFIPDPTPIYNVPSGRKSTPALVITQASQDEFYNYHIVQEYISWGMYSYTPPKKYIRIGWREYGRDHWDYDDWFEENINFSITSAAVNQNGTITFTMSDGSTVTTTGESVIGPQGPAGADYVLTAQDKQDIADIVLSELPTTQGVQYGNTSN